LPAELRLKIWKYAKPGARVSKFKINVLKAHVSKITRGVKFRFSTPVPAMLHTWRESRVEALKTSYTRGMKTVCSPPRIYIDFTQDTIYLRIVEKGCYFSMGYLVRDMPNKEMQRVQDITIE
jgi:2EXR family